MFEAPIDMLSYISLNKKGWKEHSYVALCGVGAQALFQLLQDYTELKKIHLFLDQDQAGQNAAESLAEAGYPDVRMELSAWKDWNEDIKAMHGMEAVPAEEKPPPEMTEERMLQMA